MRTEFTGPNCFAVRFSLIKTLYASLGIVYLGGAAAGVLAVINHVTVNDPVLAFLLWGLVLTSIGRTYLTLRFRKFVGFFQTTEQIDRWEERYLVGSLITLGGFGMVAATSLLRHPGDVISLIAATTCFAASLSVGTRNYASSRIVHSAPIACCMPLFAAAVWNGVVLSDKVALGIAVMPPFVAAMSIYLGRYLLRQHTETVQLARSAAVNARRFDVAIRSMPAGLILVCGDGSLMVINDKASAMLSLPEKFEGTFKAAIQTTFRAAERNQLVGALDEIVTNGEEGKVESLTLQTVDNRWLQCEVSGLEAQQALLLDRYEVLNHRDGFVVVLQEVTSKVLSESALRQAAAIDKLSGLPNRQHWERLVDEAVNNMKADEYAAVCILDIDRFKLINDTLGHHIGDEVIASVAKRLCDVSQRRMICGRVGGDEFVVFVPGLKAAEAVYSVFDQVFGEISRTYVIAGNVIDVRCSGGVVVRSKTSLNRQEDLNRADMSLHKIKKNPEKCWMLFDEIFEDEYQAKRRIKNDLRKAIEGNQLSVVYQPIYDVSGTTIHAFEALCRWHHEETGFISPAEFVQLAEEIGVIGKLTEYVIRQACRDCKSWGGNIPVAVNLSAADLARTDLVSEIKLSLREFELEPHLLSIEVTEGVFVNDFKKAAATLTELREIGVISSLDDFGTGYSSLSYLTRLPLSRVKVDRLFVANVVTDEKARKLFRAVVSLAKELDFDIVIEGVETAEQIDFVSTVDGVDFIQGYVYSKPLTAAQVIETMRSRTSPVANIGQSLRVVQN